MFDLTGKHALVTSAVGPLGRALALALAEAGADVSVTTLSNDVEQERQARAILDECRSLGRKGSAARVDLTDPVAVSTAVDAIESEAGPLTILVNAGHHATLKPLLEASVRDWEREIARNATSVFVATQAVGRLMLGRGVGRVVNVISILADRGVPNAAMFAASQGAVLGMTRSLGLEWGRMGVTVNALGLGFYEGVPGPQQDAELGQVLQRYIPLKRLGRPEDLQGALVYLVSDEAAFVDSEVIVVDGAISNHA